MFQSQRKQWEPLTRTVWTSWATLEGASHKAHYDHRESASDLTERYNAVAVLGTFAHTNADDEMNTAIPAFF